MPLRESYCSLLVLACVGLAACGPGQAGSAPDPSAPEVMPTGSQTAHPEAVETEAATERQRAVMNPSDLIGTWAVTGTDETEPVTLTVGVNELQVWRACGEQHGEWRAAPTGLFVAHTTGFEMACKDRGEPPQWLTAATKFAVEGETVVLRDVNGVAVATLVPGDTPTSPDELSYLATPPPVTDEIRDQLSRTATVPDDLEPATPELLPGRWVPADGSGSEAPQQPHVQFRADGSWSGSDGCNGSGGRWVADDIGTLLATQGPQTLIACRDMVNAGQWVSSAHAAGLDGKVLVLIGADGAETGRLVRG